MVRPLHRGDNYAADLDLNQRAFGPADPAGNEQRLTSVRRSAATRAVWSLIASHVPIAETVHAVAGPADPIGWLTAEPDIRMQRTEEWMLRVISAPAAIAARGFPAGLTASVPSRWPIPSSRPTPAPGG
jgi:Acetyltransferase (GNAT) domain